MVMRSYGETADKADSPDLKTGAPGTRAACCHRHVRQRHCCWHLLAPIIGTKRHVVGMHNYGSFLSAGITCCPETAWCMCLSYLCKVHGIEVPIPSAASLALEEAAMQPLRKSRAVYHHAPCFRADFHAPWHCDHFALRPRQAY